MRHDAKNIHEKPYLSKFQDHAQEMTQKTWIAVERTINKSRFSCWNLKSLLFSNSKTHISNFWFKKK